MTELRIIIAVIGAIILGLIYYFGTRKKTNEDDYDFSQLDPKLDQIDQITPTNNTLPKQPRPNELPRKHMGMTVDEAHAAHQNDNANLEDNSEKIITLFLHAKDGQQFDWHLIQSAADQVGLEFGQDNLYYRFNGFGDNKELVFMVANMLKPGVFQADMRTTGLVLIMTLPGVMSALDMWDSMFPVGERIAEILGGKLTDENHHIFSRQRIASMREEMREFDRQNSL